MRVLFFFAAILWSSCVPTCAKKNSQVPYVMPASSITRKPLSTADATTQAPQILLWPTQMPSIALNGIPVTAPLADDGQAVGWRACVSLPSYDQNAQAQAEVKVDSPSPDALCWLHHTPHDWKLMALTKMGGTFVVNPVGARAMDPAAAFANADASCHAALGTFEAHDTFQLATQQWQCSQTQRQWLSVDVFHNGSLIDSLVVDSRMFALTKSRFYFAREQEDLAFYIQRPEGSLAAVTWRSMDGMRSARPLQTAFANAHNGKPNEATKIQMVHALRAACREAGQPWIYVRSPNESDYQTIQCQLRTAYQDFLTTLAMNAAKRGRWSLVLNAYQWLQDIKASFSVPALTQTLLEGARKQEKLWSIHGTFPIDVPSGWSPRDDTPSLIAFVGDHKLLIRGDPPTLMELTIDADHQVRSSPLPATDSGDSSGVPLTHAWQAKRIFNLGDGSRPSEKRIQDALGLLYPRPFRLVGFTTGQAFVEWNMALWRITLPSDANTSPSATVQTQSVNGSMLGPLLTDGQRTVRVLPFGVVIHRFAPIDQYDLIVPIDWNALPARASEAAVSKDTTMLAVLSGSTVFVFTPQNIYTKDLTRY